jgi:hypothetical protein
MASFDEIKPGVRLEGLDPSGTAEVVQVSRFGPDALNLVFRANGKVGERWLTTGSATAVEKYDVECGGQDPSDLILQGSVI